MMTKNAYVAAIRPRIAAIEAHWADPVAGMGIVYDGFKAGRHGWAEAKALAKWRRRSSRLGIERRDERVERHTSRRVDRARRSEGRRADREVARE
ncbi:MAG: hypothetical protein NVS3B10_31390 [Polyangiales bacterium]